MDGQIDGAYDFYLNERVIVGNPVDGHLDFGTDCFTISCWLNVDQTTENSQLPLYKGGTSATTEGYSIVTSSNGEQITPVISDGSGNQVYKFISILNDTWIHSVGVIDRNSDLLIAYINGLEVSSEDISSVGSINNNYDLQFSHSTYDFDGLLDEIRISNVIRSADWLLTEYNNQYDPDNFYSIGKEYTVSGIPLNGNFFKFYKEITISRSMVSGSNELLNFPLLITILDTDLHDDVQQSNGNDIAFAYKGAWLDHEIESFDQAYNDTHAQLIAWVCIPRLSPSTDTIIHIYYGNLTIGSRENPEGVWDPNYKAIWHLSEDPTGTIYDSTSNDKDGTSSGSMTSNDQITGKINGAIDFDGTDDTISFGSWMPSKDFNPSSGTISFWITRQFLDSVSENKMVLQIRESGTNRIMFRYDGGDYEWRFHHEGNNIQTTKYVPADEIPRLEWIYVVQTWDVNSDFIKGYINGSLYGSSSGLAHPTNGSYTIYLASDRNGGEYFYGSIDEVRFSDIYRTDEWIETEYNNQNDPQSFLTLGPEESFDIAPPTYSNLIESSDPL
ncbi:MAG: LamG-like jellyroll fold domain-containing protein, partial [Candidatus Hermodarchaeota archaeon]